MLYRLANWKITSLLTDQHPMSVPTCAPDSVWKDGLCISKLYDHAAFLPANESCETETDNLLFMPRSETEWLTIKSMLCVVVSAHDNGDHLQPSKH